MQIRLATKDDNAALLNLSKLAPQEGVISYYSDQSPDFFRLINLMGDDCRLWVADNDGRIDGCIAEIYSKVKYNGKEANLLYIGELKVHPSARGMLAITLVTHIAAQAQKNKDNIDVGQGFILEGNERSKKLTDFYSKKVAKTVDAGYAETYQILPLKKYHVPDGYLVRNAEENDIPVIAELLTSTYAEHNAAPLFSEEWLRKEILRDSSFTIKNFRIAEKNGSVQAVAAFWDQSALRKNIVLKVSPTISLVKFVIALFRPILKMPAVPKIGEEIRYQFLRFPAHRNNDMDALKSILYSELNAMRAKPHYHFLWATFHEADPMKGIVEKTVKLKNRAYIKHLTSKSNFDFSLEGRPVYIDFSIV